MIMFIVQNEHTKGTDPGGSPLDHGLLIHPEHGGPQHTGNYSKIDLNIKGMAASSLTILLCSLNLKLKDQIVGISL